MKSNHCVHCGGEVGTHHHLDKICLPCVEDIQFIQNDTRIHQEIRDLVINNYSEYILFIERNKDTKVLRYGQDARIVFACTKSIQKTLKEKKNETSNR